MKKLFLLVFLVLANFTAFAQSNNVSVSVNVNKSESAVDSKKSLGVTGSVTYNFGEYLNITNEAHITQNDALFFSGSTSFQNNSFLQYKIERGEFRLPFIGGTVTPFVSGGAQVFTQGFNGSNKTSVNPTFGGGFAVNDNIYTQYDYTLNSNDTNNLHGHSLKVDYYRPLADSQKLQLVFGARLFSGKFDPTAGVSNDVNKLGFSIGISRKY